MKDKFSTIIMFFIVAGIIGIFIIFGIIFYSEYESLQLGNIEPEDFHTVFSEDDNITENTVDEDEIKVPQIIDNPLNKIERTNDSKNEEISDIKYDNVNVDKYFYNQLDENAKIIYRALDSNKENMKTGTYKIEFGSTFSNVLNKTNGQDLLGEYYQSGIEAYIYDNPDIFYLEPSKMYLNTEKITRGNEVTYNVYINQGDEVNYLTKEFSSKEAVDNAINKLENIKNNIITSRTGNIIDDIKLVHDYLIDNIEYDTTLSNSNIYDIYGALINKKCVCEGYARAFKYILDDMNIPCILVIGRATNSEGKNENHAWNYVMIDNKWYGVDTTWDDPVVIGGGSQTYESRYKYFLKTSDVFGKDHIPNGQFTEGGKVFEYPQI